MSWLHYNPYHQRMICVKTPDELVWMKCQLGTVTTGRSRVYAGYYARLLIEDGSTLFGRDPYNLRPALETLAIEANKHGLTLLVCGLLGHFYETGLSANSGGGYIGTRENALPVHMLDPIPEYLASQPFTDDELS